MAPRTFTPRTALETLAEIRPTVEILCHAFRGLEHAEPTAREPDGRVEPGYFALVARFYAALSRLSRSGVAVRDARSGLIDFPARRAGRRVMLCWRLGEDRVGFWHDDGAGLLERRPIDENGPWEDDAP
jgi:hypothetical protein